VLTTGDGGLLTTRRADWDRQFRLWRQHGMSVPDTVRHGSSQVLFESYPIVGFNYRMTDIQAAVGRVQLERLPGIVARRRALADRYRELLADVPGLGLPVEPAWARSNWQSFCVRLPRHADQRAVMQWMLDRGVATRRGIMCSHREAAYADVPLRTALPHSEAAQDEGLILPLYPQMTAEEQALVAGSLREACAAPRRASA
jgi:dTDP-4-amino-4,6-dideoxygalactose transaminase